MNLRDRQWRVHTTQLLAVLLALGFNGAARDAHADTLLPKNSRRIEPAARSVCVLIPPQRYTTEQESNKLRVSLLQAVTALRDRDRICIILSGATPQLITPLLPPSQSLTAVRSLQIPSSDTSINLFAATSKALAQLDSVPSSRKTIFTLSPPVPQSPDPLLVQLQHSAIKERIDFLTLPASELEAALIATAENTLKHFQSEKPSDGGHQ